MSILKYLPKYTFEDYKIWKGDWELIEGHSVSMSPSPVKKHQIVIGEIFGLFTNKLQKNNKNYNCSVYFELDWKLNNNTILRLDLVVVCDDNKSDFIEVVPSVVVEVLLPSTHLRDRNTKFQIYQENGVSYYIMIDPNSEKIEIFQLVDNRFKEVFITEFVVKKDCVVQVDLDSIFNSIVT